MTEGRADRGGIVVSNVSRHHAYHVALAAQQIGRLKTFITSSYLRSGGTLSRVLPALPMGSRLLGPLKRLSDRRSDELDSRLVQPTWFPESMTYLLNHMPVVNRAISDYRWMTAKNDMFDRAVSNRLGPCEVFHSFEGCAHHSFRKAKNLGATTILEQPIMHPETVSTVLTREYERLGLRVPEAYRDPGMARRKKQEYALADYIMVPAQSIADDFVARGTPAEKMRVIPYGASSDRFYRQPEPRDTGRFRVIFVGTVCVRKGVPYLLEAFKRLNLPDAELLLVGPVDPDVVPILTRYEGYFTHVPNMPQPELNEWYNRASVFVLPSLVEGSAYVIYEAMTCGLPAVVTPECGSVVRDGRDGFLVPARNVEALCERLLLLHDDPERAIEMGSSGMDYVRQFTWKHYMIRLIEHWDGIRSSHTGVN